MDKATIAVNVNVDAAPPAEPAYTVMHYSRKGELMGAEKTDTRPNDW